MPQTFQFIHDATGVVVCVHLYNYQQLTPKQKAQECLVAANVVLPTYHRQKS